MAHDRHAHRLGEFPPPESARRRVFRDASVDEQRVVGGDGGALLLKGERGAHRFVATGFNPFPYLGKRNLPMSVLTLNAIKLSRRPGLEQRRLSYRAAVAGAGGNFARDTSVGKKRKQLNRARFLLMCRSRECTNWSVRAARRRRAR